MRENKAPQHIQNFHECFKIRKKPYNSNVLLLLIYTFYKFIRRNRNFEAEEVEHEEFETQ